MHKVQRLLVVAGVVFVAAIGAAFAQAVVPETNVRLKVFAQAETPSAMTRIKKWTRARLAAAKKRWAQNQDKFTSCQKQLGEQQKSKRLSLHNQGHFLEKCMMQKP